MLPQQLDPSSVGSLMCAKPVQHGTLVFCLILHLHLFLNWKGYCSTTDDFTTTFLHFSLFSTALWDLANSGSVHTLMLFSHLFCLPCLFPPFTVPPCKMVLARPDERETYSYHCSLYLFMMITRSSYGLIACWILALTCLLGTRSLYEMVFG